MNFIILMAGMYGIIALQSPLFASHRQLKWLYVIGFLGLWTLYLINSTFTPLLSDTMLLGLSIIYLTPLLLAFLRQSKQDA